MPFCSRFLRFVIHASFKYPLFTTWKALKEYCFHDLVLYARYIIFLSPTTFHPMSTARFNRTSTDAFRSLRLNPCKSKSLDLAGVAALSKSLPANKWRKVQNWVRHSRKIAATKPRVVRDGSEVGMYYVIDETRRGTLDWESVWMIWRWLQWGMSAWKFGMGKTISSVRKSNDQHRPPNRK
jgi:hypothetical protein